MKKTKIALTLVCAILLIAASVMGTLAYLTSTPDAVVNTFTVGENVSITLDEAKTNDAGEYLKKVPSADGAADTYATTTVKAEAERVKANTYKLMPGHNYKKDPTVHVTGEDCYIFVTISNEISAIEADTTIANQMAAKNWKLVDGYTNLYVYAEGDAAATVVTKGMDKVVFEEFTVKTTETSLTSYANKTITIKAYAIQADGMPNTAAGIWALIGSTDGIQATT